MQPCPRSVRLLGSSLAAGCVALFIACGGPGSSGAGKPMYPGETCVLATGDLKTVWVATSEANFDEMNKYLSAKDDDGIREMMLAGKMFVVPRGTRAKIISTSLFHFEVRILDGDHGGERGCIAREWAHRESQAEGPTKKR